MGVAGDATEGTHMACVMSGDMGSFVCCCEILSEGHILVTSCVSAGVVAAGVGSITKRSISFHFTDLQCTNVFRCAQEQAC